MTIRGKVHKYGDNVDTDVIIPGRYCNLVEPEDLKKHCLEDLDPDFVKKAKTGDILMGGENFGCGSSREVAPITIKAAGVSAVVAKSFARIFFRNSINIGMPIFECPAAVEATNAGQEIEIDPESGAIRNLTTGKSYKASPLPPEVRAIVDLGGLIEYAKRRVAAGKGP